MYSSAVFAGGRPLCAQIVARHSCPLSAILGTRKPETLGYPVTKTASFRVHRFDTISKCDGQTQTDERKDLP